MVIITQDPSKEGTRNLIAAIASAVAVVACVVMLAVGTRLRWPFIVLGIPCLVVSNIGGTHSVTAACQHDRSVTSLPQAPAMSRCPD